MAELDRVDVWLGWFPSREALDEWFEESFSDDHSLISRFAEAMDVSFYDHDFVERALKPDASDPLALLADLSYSVSYAQTVAARWREVQASPLPFRSTDAVPLNTVVLAFGGVIAAPSSARGPDHELHYVGQFDCDPSTGGYL
tara:strand:+ start:1552 stop:1980 length:429 start_codon:yes stop_codon:yes gene_type:complete